VSRNVYVIAGANGVGKTTFAREFLPEFADCKNFINADLIAQGLSPFSPESQSFRAGRLMLEEISSYIGRGEDFGFETTLAGLSHLASIRRMKERGYFVHCFYLWLPHVELTLARIRRRVLEGGHDVPEAVARRRFTRSIQNFLALYRNLADSWVLYDNSDKRPIEIAFERERELHILVREAYEALVSRYGHHDQAP